MLARKVQSKRLMEHRKPHLIKMLKSLDDFYLELKWDFQTWSKL